MMYERFLRRAFVAVFLVLPIAATSVLGQGGATNGTLKIHVTPKQAYVFVDDKAIRAAKMGELVLPQFQTRQKIGIIRPPSTWNHQPPVTERTSKRRDSVLGVVQKRTFSIDFAALWHLCC
jgi:hypothetical protein